MARPGRSPCRGPAACRARAPPCASSRARWPASRYRNGVGSQSAHHKLDVAILGGGLAGSFLARQLRRTVPELRIGLFEKSTERSYKVGESTVEIASSYLTRRLGLSRYLYHEHLPKNGLRYFFDGPGCDAALPEMSEVGTANLPFHPAFQIDRARMEADLLADNAEAGVEVRIGARVKAVSLGQDGAHHRFEVIEKGRKTAHEARWLVDATGRTSLLAKLKGLRAPESEHCLGAAWGRFEHVADVDEMGPPQWRERVRYTARGLSTLHFCYPGYWIWVIPLRNGLTSVGVTGAKEIVDSAVRSEAGLRAFLERHRAVGSLLREAKLVDFGGYTQIAYGTRQFFDAARWAVVGEAAAAQDPLYSPGIDFIALENDFVTDLIRREVAGESEADRAERTALYDRFMLFRHEATMRLYRGLYGVLGSYEIMRMKWDLDVGSYYNMWVAAYMQDMHLDATFLEQQLSWQPFLLQGLTNFARLFRNVEAHLKERGTFQRANRGRFSSGLENIDFVEEVGLPRTRRKMLKKAGELFNVVRQRALDLLEVSPEARLRAPLALSAFLSDRPLA
ncbi:MAG TPA: electron transfer flavoprotein [Deltaproteobacteria bacterium]|nr:electron transfer flavoprotein [Deltaproteobacteria bacterium]